MQSRYFRLIQYVAPITKRLWSNTNETIQLTQNAQEFEFPSRKLAPACEMQQSTLPDALNHHLCPFPFVKVHIRSIYKQIYNKITNNMVCWSDLRDDCKKKIH